MMASIARLSLRLSRADRPSIGRLSPVYPRIYLPPYTPCDRRRLGAASMHQPYGW